MRACLIALSFLLGTFATPARALPLAFEMTFTSADGVGTVLGEGSAGGAGTFDVGAGEIVLGPVTWTWLPATSGVGPPITFRDWTHTLTGNVAGTTLTVSPTATPASFDADCAGGGICFFFLGLGEAFFTALDPDLVFTTLAPGGTGSQAYTGTFGAILHTVAVDFSVVPEPRGLLVVALGAPWLASRARRQRASSRSSPARCRAST